MTDMTPIEAAHIEATRNILRRAGQHIGQLKDLPPVDVALAGTYAAHDLAFDLTGDPFAAVEWLRTALDLLERQALADASHGHA